MKVTSIHIFKSLSAGNRNIGNVVLFFQMFSQFSKLHFSSALKTLDFSLRWDVSPHNSLFSRVNCRVVANVLTLFLYQPVYISSLLGPAELLPGAQSLRTLTRTDYGKKRNC